LYKEVKIEDNGNVTPISALSTMTVESGYLRRNTVQVTGLNTAGVYKVTPIQRPKDTNGRWLYDPYVYATVTVDTSKLPNGVTYDPTTKTISGTPAVTNWGPNEETKTFEVPVVVTNPDGSKVTKTVEITVQRDTDRDGTPDVTDTDDDGDGYLDSEETAKGSDPKNPYSLSY